MHSIVHALGEPEILQVHIKEHLHALDCYENVTLHSTISGHRIRQKKHMHNNMQSKSTKKTLRTFTESQVNRH